MADQELEGEVSLDVALSETGIKAAVKTRLINALDYVGASYVVNKFKSKAGATREGAAIGDARMAMLKALEETAVERIKSEPHLADAFIQSQLGTLLRREENKAASVERAIEDLTNVPPSDNEEIEGPESVAPETLNRWTRYAEDASTEELRDRWGKVLAQEIRTPGTFSSQVMRIVDEMDQHTAQMFEEVCKHRVKDMIPLAVSGEFSFNIRTALVNSGLIIEPGLTSQQVILDQATDGQGMSWHFLAGMQYAVGLSGDAVIKTPGRDEDRFISKNGKGFTARVYIMTPAAVAIATIIKTDEFLPIRTMRDAIRARLIKGDTRLYAAFGSEFQPIPGEV